MAALNKENCAEHPRNNLAQNSNVPRSQEDYITEVSEEIEGRFTKMLSQEFSRTEKRTLGALARLDDFLMNRLIQTETSRNAMSTSQGTNEDDSQNDPQPEAGVFHNQMTQNFGPEDGHDMVTDVHEEVTYCSTSTSSPKQKKNRSTSQPQFHSENTPATIEADQTLLALQQLAKKQQFCNFPKTMLTEYPKCQSRSRQ